MSGPASPEPRYHATVERYDALSASDVEAWRDLCSQHADYDSALLSPEFAHIVSNVRDDVRIIRINEGDALRAVMPVHLRPDGLARPLGTPFADYSGPVLSSKLEHSLSDVLQMTGIAAFASPAVPDPWSRVHCRDAGMQDDETVYSHVIRASGDNADSLLETQRAQHSKRFKNVRRLRNQLEREAGPVRFEWGNPDAKALEALYQYKSEQFRQSGYVDLIHATKARELLDAVARGPYAFMTSLWIGENLISGHFGVRVGAAFHPWIAAFNPAFAHFSPGNILLLSVLEQIHAMDLRIYDLANGHDHYKKYFANAYRAAWPVFETGAGIGAVRHRLGRLAWKIAGADAPASLAGRLQRRVDQIAVSEFSALSRLREFIYAVRTRSVPPRGN